MRRSLLAAAVLLSFSPVVQALTLWVDAPDEIWPLWEHFVALNPPPATVIVVRAAKGAPAANLLRVQLGAGTGFKIVARTPLAPVARLGDARDGASRADIRAGKVRLVPLDSITLPDVAVPVDGRTADQPGYPLSGDAALRLESSDHGLIDWFDSLPPAAPATPAEILWIGAVGDVMPARGVDTVLRAPDGPRRVFGDTLEVFKGCGLVIGNLEATATLGGAKAAKTFTFRFAPDALQGLAAGGFAYLSLANNHTFDFGRQGFLDTLAGLSRWGIGTAGAGVTVRDAALPFSARRGNTEVRILSFAAYPVDRTGFDGQKVARAGDDTPGTLWLDDAGLAAASEAFSGTAFSIATVHGGVEWSSRPTGEQRRSYRALVNAGADLVVGSHPHVLQGMEAREGRLIAYSLGNFLFPGMEGTPGGEDSVILKLGVFEGAIRYVQAIPVRLSGGTVRLAGSGAAAAALRALSRSLAEGR